MGRKELPATKENKGIIAQASKCKARGKLGKDQVLVELANSLAKRNVCGGRGE